MNYFNYIEAFNNSTSDKNHLHKYAIVYDYIINTHFSIKNDLLSMLEVGIRYGDSLEVWDSSPQFNKIVGMDINDKETYLRHLKENNLTRNFSSKVELLHGVDAYDKEVSKDLFNKGYKFDIILDDGDHQFDSQIKFFNNYYDLLNPGGVLICEDISGAYIPQLQHLAQEYEDFYVFDIRAKSNKDGNEIIAILKK